MYVCVCNAVTERQLRDSVACGADSLDQVSYATGLGLCCGRCREFAAELIEDLQAHSETAPA